MCKILWFKLNYVKDCFRSQKGLVYLCDRASNCSPVFKVVVNCVGLKLPTRVRSYFYSSVFAGFIESLEMTGPVQYFNFFCIRNSARVKRGGLNSSGSNTPIGRGSRSSSVASAHNRKASAVTPKIKTKLGRGYNPSLVNYKDSEYHYGSDFEDDGEDDNEEQASEHSSDEVRIAFMVFLV
jgi:hypothetical protein